MNHSIFRFLQKMGKSFMLPIAVLPIAGIFLGLGSSLTNATTISALHAESILSQGTLLYRFLILLKTSGNVLFDNLPLIIAVSIALGMAKQRKEVPEERLLNRRDIAGKPHEHVHQREEKCRCYQEQYRLIQPGKPLPFLLSHQTAPFRRAPAFGYTPRAPAGSVSRRICGRMPRRSTPQPHM